MRLPRLRHGTNRCSATQPKRCIASSRRWLRAVRCTAAPATPPPCPISATPVPLPTFAAAGTALLHMGPASDRTVVCLRPVMREQPEDPVAFLRSALANMPSATGPRTVQAAPPALPQPAPAPAPSAAPSTATGSTATAAGLDLAVPATAEPAAEAATRARGRRRARSKTMAGGGAFSEREEAAGKALVELKAQVDRLRAENSRLRWSFAVRQTARYRLVHPLQNHPPPLRPCLCGTPARPAALTACACGCGCGWLLPSISRCLLS